MLGAFLRGDTIFQRGQRGEVGERLRLVPVPNRIKAVCAVVGVTVRDGVLEAISET